MFLKQSGTTLDACVPYTEDRLDMDMQAQPASSYPAQPAPLKCDTHCKDGHLITSHDKVFTSSAYPVIDKPGDATAMQWELVTHGPFETIFWVFSDFEHYTNGTYQRSANATGPLGGHAVKVVGYGTDIDGVPYWTCANSYGAAWGSEGGFFNIRRGTNECGMETVPTAGAPAHNVKQHGGLSSS